MEVSKALGVDKYINAAQMNAIHIHALLQPTATLSMPLYVNYLHNNCLVMFAPTQARCTAGPPCWPPRAAHTPGR